MHRETHTSVHFPRESISTFIEENMTFENSNKNVNCQHTKLIYLRSFFLPFFFFCESKIYITMNIIYKRYKIFVYSMTQNRLLSYQRFLLNS